ncbi:MAG: hypothetical protein ABI614_08510 [Planctomycetota bacterium]
MIFESGETADTSTWHEMIDAYEPEVARLAQDYPENLDLPTLPLEYLRGLAQYSHTEKLTGEEREKVLMQADAAFLKHEAALNRVVKQAPLVNRMVSRLAILQQYREQIAHEQGDEESSLRLSLAGRKIARDFYDARFAEAPDEPEWMLLAANEAFIEASILYRTQPAQALERIREARSRLERVYASQSTNPHMVAMYAKIIGLEIGTEHGMMLKAADVSLHAPEFRGRLFAAETQVLELRRKVLTLVEPGDRPEARQMVDDAFNSIASSLRLDTIFRSAGNKPGPYLVRQLRCAAARMAGRPK